MTLLHLGDIPICPAVVASDTEKTQHGSKIFKNNNTQPPDLEKEVLAFVGKHHDVGGLACYPLDGEDLNNAYPQNANRLIHGSLGLAWKIGEQLLQYEGLDKLLGLLESNGIRSYTLIENATYKKIEPITPLDVGHYQLANDQKRLWLFYENEALLLWDPDTRKPVAMGPDSINFLLAEPQGDFPAGTPLSTAGLNANSKYTVVGVAAFEKTRNKKMEDFFVAAINKLTYSPNPNENFQIAKYIPIEELNE